MSAGIVMFSIRPVHSQNILAGRKTCEFRRRLSARIGAESRILIYECVPTGRVVGEARVASIMSSAPADLWSATSDRGGVSRKLFDDYFAGREIAHAIVLVGVTRYEVPRHLSDYGIARAPQSYCYVYES